MQNLASKQDLLNGEIASSQSSARCSPICRSQSGSRTRNFPSVSKRLQATCQPTGIDLESARQAPRQSSKQSQSRKRIYLSPAWTIETYPLTFQVQQVSLSIRRLERQRPAETGAPKSQAVLEQFCSPQFCSSDVLCLLRPSSQSVPDSVQSAVWHTLVWDRLHRRLSCSLF